jgi:parallel beta-helix repeat protein
MKALSLRWNSFARVTALAMLAAMPGCQSLSTKQAATSPSTTSTFSISGAIGPAVSGSGATVKLSGATSSTTVADGSGNYTFTGLTSGTYAVTASKNAVKFSPSSLQLTLAAADLTGVNFTASAPSNTYAISGTITPAASGAGATLTLGGASSVVTTADGSGNYSFSGLASGSYTIAASKSAVSFTPPSSQVTLAATNLTGINFSASTVANTYSISGTVSPAANAAGVTVTLSGASNSATTPNGSGNYSFTGLAGGSYTITASKNAVSITPSSLQVSVGAANITGQNFTVSSGAVVTISPGTSIQSAVNANPAGTTFMLQPGTYRLPAPVIPLNGDNFIGQTSCAPPATSCPAILSGSTVIGSSAVFDGQNYEVSGQTQQNPRGASTTNCDPGWLGCIYPEDLFFDGIPYQHLSSATLPAIGSGQWWFDYTNHIIYFHDNPAGHTVETSVINNAFGGSANNVNIQYLTIEEFAPMYPSGTIGVSQGDFALTQSTNWTVQNCEIMRNHGYGVRVGYGIQILNNYIHDNGQTGIGGGIGVVTTPTTESTNSEILIEGNLITHNDYAHFDANFGSGGIKLGSTSGVTIRGNTIQYNEGSGVHFDDYSQNELLDGNTITDNVDSDGVNQEMGYGVSTFRNNVVLRNGAQIYESHFAEQIGVHASAGVAAYCNVMEISSGPGINGWSMGAANRGSSTYPPLQYLTATGNSFHHNTVIWDAGATGGVGFMQDDAANQPNFFADNAPPDYNTYHLPSSASAAHFLYDNNDTQNNTPNTFAAYQANGADAHGAADVNYTSGFPTVAITSPADQSSFTGPVAVTATASDASGISQVEFYLDWALQSTVTAAPYSFTFPAGATGAHTVAAMAYSNAGIRACYGVTVNRQ